MPYFIAGLGNPGEEYKDTRHNTGRIVAEFIATKNNFSDFKEDLKTKSLLSKGEIKGEKITIVNPNNFMNRSGASLAPYITSLKKAQNLIVIYDDLDLPLGTIKISYNRSSGGHRGVESIIKALKTEEFMRIRVGISPVTPAGKLKKPKGETGVENHIIGPFKKPELETIHEVAKMVLDAIETIISEGKNMAMTKFN